MLQTLGPSLANATIASLIFLYLWARDRERYMAIWGLAWALWVFRYSYGLFSDQLVLVPTSVVLPLLALARGGLVLWGTYALMRTPMPRPWLLIFAADFILVLIEGWTGSPLRLLGPPGVIHYTLFAASLMWSGALFTRASGLPQFEARITGFALVLFGLAQTVFPMLSSFPDWYTQLLYVVVGALQAVVPIGVLMAYLRRSAAEVESLHQELAGALTLALSEHLPICAHCKSIRDKDEWVGIERYVSGRTATTFSHGICPACFEKHYPELGPYEEQPA